MRILIADEISGEAMEILRANGLEVDVRTGLVPEDLAAIVGGYDALIVRSTTRLTRAIIEKAGRLQVIGRAGIGVDNVDVEAATEKGIIVMNSPRGNALAAAEHTLALMLALARHVPIADRSMKQGKWEKRSLTGVELGEKTLGIVGAGNVGMIVAGKALALGMKVLAHDPFVHPTAASERGVEMCDLDTLLGTSDFVTIHVPLNDGTRHLINKESLAKTKKGAFIINAARGGIVDENDLYDAIESGHIAGAGLDVFEHEPPTEASKLVLSDKVIATPHLAGSTEEAQKRVALDMAHQITDFARDGVIRNSVNCPTLSIDVKNQTAPFLPLTEKLARFIALVTDGPFDEIEIEYRGGIAEIETTMLTRGILSHILSPRARGVNYVNAPVIAGSMGIKWREIKEKVHYYLTSLLVIRLKKGESESAAYGTLLRENEARLMRVNRIMVDADLTGKILLVHAYDRPGVIGGVASLLGDKGINIGDMHFGREKVGGPSLSLFDVDQPVDDATVQAILSVPGVIDVKRLDLS